MARYLLGMLTGFALTSAAFALAPGFRDGLTCAAMMTDPYTASHCS